jgi:hypothetical protein
MKFCRVGLGRAQLSAVPRDYIGWSEGTIGSRALPIEFAAIDPAASKMLAL